MTWTLPRWMNWLDSLLKEATVKTIRWGIIGCGDVTEVKSGPGFQKAKNSSLVAVMRRNGKLAEEYARRHSVPKWYDNADALIQDPDVDAVYIATPPYAHKEYTLMCARAGKPVYVEKPMGMNFAECQEMIKACRRLGATFCGLLPAQPARFLKIKELLDAGAIGDVRGVTVTLYMPLPDKFGWHYTPEVGGGGKFVDMGCHTLDFLDHILGPIRSVAGFAGNLGGHYPAEDIVTGAFEFESGVQAVGIWSFTTFKMFDRAEIVGTREQISFSSFDATPIVLSAHDERDRVCH